MAAVMSPLTFDIPAADAADALTQLIAASPQAQHWRAQLLSDALPNFLLQQRWFGAKGQRIERIEFEQLSQWDTAGETWLLALLRVTLAHGAPQVYFLPLALAWEDAAHDIATEAVLARIQTDARSGWLYDALAAPSFSRALVTAIGERTAIAFGAGQIQGVPTAAYARLRGTAALTEVKNPKVSGSNTALILDDRLFLKIYRRLHVGINPEVEIGRFLTDAAPYAHIVPVAGYLHYRDAGREMTVAVLQGSVEHQGDAWNGALDSLERDLTQSLATDTEGAMDADFLHQMATLGRRTAEMHAALCKSTGDSAFDPEPIGASDIAAWQVQVREDGAATLTLLAHKAASLAGPAGAQAAQLLDRQAMLIEPILHAMPTSISAMKSRYHGDYHLGQVLQSNGDYILIDFEGEPTRTLAERRMKHCPLRDVAGMLRSFSYAAAVALDRCAQRHPESYPALARRARSCEVQTVSAFLQGYAEASENLPCVPQDPQQTQALIALFCLEKALYELRYELDNRPTWVGVPLAGLLQLSETAESGAH